MSVIKLTQECNPRLILEPGLSVVHQQRLRVRWNGVVTDPFAFIPHEKKGKVTVTEALEQNNWLGGFAGERIRRICRLSTPEDITRRVRDKRKILAVGYGRGYDGLWLKEAVSAGFQVWWIDVSDVSCDMATADMKAQYASLQDQKGLTPTVKQGEIRSVFADPSSIGLDLSSVEIFYYCRTLTCLSVRSAEVVLCQTGYFSLSREMNNDRKNAIEIVCATRDYNPTRIGHTSKLYYIKEILAHIARGAGCPVEIVDEESTKYFDQVYTAMTIRSK
jgi:hypothetical protein